ncbi:MAG: hypothetical protein IJE18_06660 [Bacteroidaceae bacterium]|nr:hypothetical protein [Bacteroidaceae bacterium]
MKRSTIFLIVALAVIIIAPIIYISIAIRSIPSSLKDWVIETIEDADFENENLYNYKMLITATDATSVPDCYISITTYEGAVDSMRSVHFIDPSDGVSAVLRGDSILVMLDKVDALVGEGLCLTIELPRSSDLKIYNDVPTADVRLQHASVGAMLVSSLSDLLVSDSNLGVLSGSDCIVSKKLDIENSNVGAMKINGDNLALRVDDSNVGAMDIMGTCSAIELSDSNFGVCSWNDACRDMAVIEDCTITSHTNAGSIIIKSDDDGKTIVMSGDAATSSIVKVESDSDKVDISPSGILVETETGEKVNVSLTGVHVETEDETVQITPTGIVVKEDGKEIVKIGL